jgi:hypothetical protein
MVYNPLLNHFFLLQTAFSILGKLFIVPLKLLALSWIFNLMGGNSSVLNREFFSKQIKRDAIWCKKGIKLFACKTLIVEYISRHDLIPIQGATKIFFLGCWGDFMALYPFWISKIHKLDWLENNRSYLTISLSKNRLSVNIAGVNGCESSLFYLDSSS